MGEGAVVYAEAITYFIYKCAHFTHVIACGVDDYSGGAVSHVECNEEVLVLVAHYLHWHTCGEEAGSMAVDGIAFLLHEFGVWAIAVALESDGLCTCYVSDGEMHVVACREVDGIAGFTCIHLVFLLLQELLIAAGIVEGEVYVFCKLSEYMLCEGFAQCVSYFLIDIGIEHGVELCLYVGDETQCVVDSEVCAAVVEILVDGVTNTRRETTCQQQAEPEGYILQRVNHYCF